MYKINLEYNLVDINKISNQTLTNQNTIFGYTMLAKKSENEIELIDNISLIINTTENKEKIQQLTDIVNYLLYDISDEKKKQNILEKIYKKMDKNDMNTLYDKLQNENK